MEEYSERNQKLQNTKPRIDFLNRIDVAVYLMDANKWFADVVGGRRELYFVKNRISSYGRCLNRSRLAGNRINSFRPFNKCQ